jgi:hypothetical protein
MPRTAKSESTKAKLVASFESVTLHQLIRKDHHNDWYCSEDNSFELFLTFSHATFKRAPWYDMEPADIDALASHSAAFIIFILEQPGCFLVIPAKTLADRLSNAGKITKDGRYMFNINRSRKGEFAEIPGWNLKPYLNNLEPILKMNVTAS